MIDVGALRECFSVAHALDAFGVRHARSRAACPICAGGNTQAFAFGGRRGGGWLWQCFACGSKGDAVDLVAKLAGITKGAALYESARLAGLGDSPPSEIAALAASRREAREAEESAERAAFLERNRLLDVAAQAERDHALLVRTAYRVRSRDALAMAYDEELSGMIAAARADEM